MVSVGQAVLDVVQGGVDKHAWGRQWWGWGWEGTLPWRVSTRCSVEHERGRACDFRQASARPPQPTASCRSAPTRPPTIVVPGRRLDADGFVDGHRVAQLLVGYHDGVLAARRRRGRGEKTARQEVGREREVAAGGARPGGAASRRGRPPLYVCAHIACAAPCGSPPMPCSTHNTIHTYHPSGNQPPTRPPTHLSSATRLMSPLHTAYLMGGVDSSATVVRCCTSNSATCGGKRDAREEGRTRNQSRARRGAGTGRGHACCGPRGGEARRSAESRVGAHPTRPRCTTASCTPCSPDPPSPLSGTAACRCPRKICCRWWAAGWQPSW